MYLKPDPPALSVGERVKRSVELVQLRALDQERAVDGHSLVHRLAHIDRHRVLCEPLDDRRRVGCALVLQGEADQLAEADALGIAGRLRPAWR